MSTGTISSLGLGSGVLTQSVIDQLKAADTNAIITPITRSISANNQQQASMSMLSSLASTLTSSVSALGNSTLYQNRTVTGSNSAVSVTASNGVAVQNFTISNTKLATTSVSQSGSFASSSALAATGTGKLNLNVNGNDYTISYDGTTTYDQLKTSINDIAGADVTASILQTGTSSYSLVLNSKNTGAAQQVTMTDLSGNLNSNLKSDALMSGAYASNTSSIATGSGTLTLNAAGVNSTFNYTSTTSLTDLANMINNDPTAGANVTARVIKNDQGTYNLVLTAKSGSQPITLSDQASGGSLSSGLTTGSTAMNGSMSSIQAASDASFKYNGINMTRSSNTITDITTGMTINLLSTDSTSTANISITQDTSSVQSALQSFVDNYNAMEKQLNSMTVTNSTNLTTATTSSTSSTTPALFQGDSTLNGIDRDIKNIVTSVDNKTGLSLTQFGITVNQDGTLAFDTGTFNTAMSANTTAMNNYFSGTTTVDAYGNATTTNGIFTTLYNDLNNVTKSGGVLDNLTTGLTTEATNLATQQTNATNALNAKYDTMTQQFIAYDTMISSLNNQFSALSQQISMAAAGKG